ncbi:MAG: tryptophan--tRNA ligase [Firmicutes bacterium]|nr:tryptophan--tRNA ligase [Bacillota bacterium]MCL5040167.1 tryptophan--tRNA ligase [Bacillota bacterium]
MRKRILSGMRPTGRLHLGNYFGALENWVRLQDEFECYFAVVDWHALTTGYEDTGELKANTREMVIDWVSAGLDPEKSVIFVQSHVKEHAELHLLLSMVTPLSWLERVPTYKEQLRELEGREISTYGFLGYPVLQAADILIYKADVVPVGEDQMPHIELTREIARRFNHFYGDVLPEPQGRLGKAAVLPGIDGRKMSKSYGNHIMLAASPAEVEEKVGLMVTDPARIRKNDPGHPDVCNVFAFHRLLNPSGWQQLEVDCQAGMIGCVQCKRDLNRYVNEFLKPIRAKREELEKRPDLVEDIIREGDSQAREVAARTMEEVRAAMQIGDR